MASEGSREIIQGSRGRDPNFRPKRRARYFCDDYLGIGWLATHARLDLKESVDDFVEELTSRTAVRPITARIAILASQLPATYPNDPCDRLIGATAMAEGIALVTKDRSIRGHKLIKTIW